MPEGVQGWDRFAYGNNSPVVYNDPSGHWALESNRPEDEIRKNSFHHAYKRQDEKRGALSAHLKEYYLTAAAHHQSRMDESQVDIEIGAELLESKANAVQINGWNGVADAQSAAGDVGLVIAPEFVAQTGMGLAGIVITPEGLAHVIDSHTAGGSSTYGKSIFSSDVDLTDLIKQAEGTPPTQAKNGYLVRVVNAGTIVGIDRATGLPTSTYTVVTNSSGGLISAYPGLPSHY